jgi:Ni,Fe-hydrogenase I small subunit
MAITRRQFVTTLSALAAAAGIGQTEISQLTEAFAHGGAVWGTGSWTNKPKVVWVHGAECTGCSTSLLGLFEDALGGANDLGYSTIAALDLAVGGTGNGNAVLHGQNTVPTTGAEAGHPWGHRTMENTYAVSGMSPDSAANTAYAIDIADVLLDFIDLQYHETVMAMGGDLAYQSLLADMGGTTPFVLVVEGAVQNWRSGGFWKKTDTGGSPTKTPWCSIGRGDTSGEADFSTVVETLATNAACAQVIAIGQCACYGGYPACKGPGLAAMGSTNYDQSVGQTGAMGVFDFLTARTQPAAAAKVVNVPGCPTNPWWFVLTVVAWLVDANFLLTGSPAIGANGPLGILRKTGAGATAWAINLSAIDSATSRRLNAVYNFPLHNGRCPRYGWYSMGIYANHPGDAGCLQLIGCKGPSTKSLCSRHGWNNAQPNNSASSLPSHSKATLLDSTTSGYKAGSHCITAGHPCMGCTQKGYPDAFSPFVVNR